MSFSSSFFGSVLTSTHSSITFQIGRKDEKKNQPRKETVSEFVGARPPSHDVSTGSSVHSTSQLPLPAVSLFTGERDDGKY